MDHTELLGAGASLLLLGAVAGMCVWCPRLGTRRSKQIFYEQRDEGRQSFAVARTFSIAGMVPETAEYSTIQCPEPRKDKWLYSMAEAEDPDITRYQNLRKDDDDTISYENILICKPMEEVEEVADYQNSCSIEQWRQSVKVESARLSLGSPEDDSSEPDYVNGDVGFMQ
ncbi:linker for activation of T-cells family member 2 isoform 2-T2 [Sarcophilus harrisii]